MNLAILCTSLLSHSTGLDTRSPPFLQLHYACPLLRSFLLVLRQKTVIVSIFPCTFDFFAIHQKFSCFTHKNEHARKCSLTETLS